MDKVNLFVEFQRNGFRLNPNTQRWTKQAVDTKNGELPTNFMSEETYWYSGIYIRKARKE